MLAIDIRASINGLSKTDQLLLDIRQAILRLGVDGVTELNSISLTLLTTTNHLGPISVIVTGHVQPIDGTWREHTILSTIVELINKNLDEVRSRSWETLHPGDEQPISTPKRRVIAQYVAAHIIRGFDG